MMSSRIVTGAFLVGVLAASPALAQQRNARPRSEQGSNSQSSNNGGDRGNRGSERRAEGARAYQPQRAPEGRSNNNSQQVQGGQYTASRQYNNASRQYAPAGQSTAPRQYNNAARSYSAPRAYSNSGYNNGGYNSGHYSNGGYNAPRVYTAPRAYSYSNGHGYNKPYAYSSHGYAPPRAAYYGGYAKPYYYHGYRGVYGYGGAYRHTRIVTVVPWRPYYYRPHFSIGVYYGAGGIYNYGYTPSYYYDPIPGRVYGGVRITDAPQDAQVFADGYYVGIVDDFDGTFQHVNLEAGQHRIEVRAGGIPPISFDVYVQPGRTITLRADDYNDGYSGDPNANNGDGY
jgi:hypothetical protein